MEKWLPISGYEGRYEVSNYGNVRSTSRRWTSSKPRNLIPTNNRKYLSVKLQKNHVKKMRLIHRLVLETFGSPCPPGMECSHLDGNAHNNRIENLKWETRVENLHRDVAHGKRTWAKLTQNEVLEIKALKGKMLQREIAARYGIARPTVGEIHRGLYYKYL